MRTKFVEFNSLEGLLFDSSFDSAYRKALARGSLYDRPFHRTSIYWDMLLNTEGPTAVVFHFRKQAPERRIALGPSGSLDAGSFFGESLDVFCFCVKSTVATNPFDFFIHPKHGPTDDHYWLYFKKRGIMRYLYDKRELGDFFRRSFLLSCSVLPFKLRENIFMLGVDYHRLYDGLKKRGGELFLKEPSSFRVEIPSMRFYEILEAVGRPWTLYIRNDNPENEYRIRARLFFDMSLFIGAFKEESEHVARSLSQEDVDELWRPFVSVSKNFVELFEMSKDEMSDDNKKKLIESFMSLFSRLLKLDYIFRKIVPEVAEFQRKVIDYFFPGGNDAFEELKEKIFSGKISGELFNEYDSMDVRWKFGNVEKTLYSIFEFFQYCRFATLAGVGFKADLELSHQHSSLDEFVWNNAPDGWKSELLRVFVNFGNPGDRSEALRDVFAESLFNLLKKRGQFAHDSFDVVRRAIDVCVEHYKTFLALNDLTTLRREVSRNNWTSDNRSVGTTALMFAKQWLGNSIGLAECIFVSPDAITAKFRDVTDTFEDVSGHLFRNIFRKLSLEAVNHLVDLAVQFEVFIDGPSVQEFGVQKKKRFMEVLENLHRNQDELLNALSGLWEKIESYRTVEFEEKSIELDGKRVSLLSLVNTLIFNFARVHFLRPWLDRIYENLLSEPLDGFWNGGRYCRTAYMHGLAPESSNHQTGLLGTVKKLKDKGMFKKNRRRSEVRSGLNTFPHETDDNEPSRDKWPRGIVSVDSSYSLKDVLRNALEASMDVSEATSRVQDEMFCLSFWNNAVYLLKEPRTDLMNPTGKFRLLWEPFVEVKAVDGRPVELPYLKLLLTEEVERKHVPERFLEFLREIATNLDMTREFDEKVDEERIRKSNLGR